MDEQKQPLDFFETPEAATLALLDFIRIDGPVFEICAGTGKIAKVLRKAGYEVKTNDSCTQFKTDYRKDVSKAGASTGWQPYKDSDWIITNPPFSKAIEIVSNTVNKKKKCAFLLRLSFLEPTKRRGKFLSECPPNKLIVLPRISFTGDGKTDWMPCAWFIWDNDLHVIDELVVIDREEFKSYGKAWKRIEDEE